MFDNRRIMDLYDRVFKLDDNTNLKVVEVKDHPFFGMVTHTSNIPAKTAIRLILNHLGLKIEHAPVSEEFQLVKKEE